MDSLKNESMAFIPMQEYLDLLELKKAFNKMSFFKLVKLRFFNNK